jgi:polycomb protein SUZ12
LISIILEPCAKRRRKEEAHKLFGGELIVYDRHNRCLLVAGDYELALSEIQQPSRGSPKKHSSWENAAEVQVEVSINFAL